MHLRAGIRQKTEKVQSFQRSNFRGRYGNEVEILLRYFLPQLFLGIWKHFYSRFFLENVKYFYFLPQTFWRFGINTSTFYRAKISTFADPCP